MNRTASATLLSGLLLLSPSCSVLADRPARVGDLVSWVERVHVESELAKQKMRTATTLLADIVDNKYEGPAVEAYKKFVTALEESEAQATALRNAVSPMKSNALAVFQQWERDIHEISSSAIRIRSKERRATAEQRYNAVVSTVDPTQEAYDTLNRSLRDHALFLGNDFNPASVSMIRDEVLQLTRQVEELDGRFDTCLQAARSYVNSYSLPVSANPGAAPGAAPGEAPQPGPQK